MSKTFNTTGVCIPEKHYMVNLESRLKEIKSLVDTDSYFVINKVRQYGKTTTLRVLYKYLRNEYYVCDVFSDIWKCGFFFKISICGNFFPYLYRFV